MRPLNRRDFLHDSTFLATALAGAGLAGSATAADKPAGAAKSARSASSGDRLRVAVVGVHGRGLDHVHGFANRNGCVITTICDCDEDVIGPAMRIVKEVQGRAPRYEKDIRKLVEDRDIDIVSIATPNHWHSLAAIWAMQNDKDVYVEKPVSHNVREGRIAVEVARATRRICQAGTQSRSMAGMREAIKFLRSGKLGKVKVAHGLCYKPRGSIGKVKGPQEVPASVDYDLWCGPAPKGPLLRERLHYDWHWFWDYGNGDLGNQGIHQMDIARWGLGKSELAPSALSLGGRFGYVDDGQTANTQVCVFDYGDCELIFEVRGLRTRHYKGAKVGVIFEGSKGYLVCPTYESAVAFTPDGEIMHVFQGAGDHYGNFVQAVRNRKAEGLNGDILEGHLSSALCHLGNISYRLGRDLPFGKEGEALGKDREAADTVARLEEHLRSNRLKLNAISCRVGRKLTFDPKKETFIGDKEADAMLTREYRKGFEVPAKV